MNQAFVGEGRRHVSERGFNPVRTIPIFLMVLLFVCSGGCHSAAPPTVAKPIASSAVSAAANPVASALRPDTPEKAGSKRSRNVSMFFEDARSGKVIFFSGRPPTRIVSLAPSSTEILFALGLTDYIAGVTSADDYPLEAKQKPNVGGYPISAEKVQALNPDLIIAVSGVNDVNALKYARCPILSVKAQTLTDVYDSIRKIGGITGVKSIADSMVNRMKAQIVNIERVTTSDKMKPKVLVLHQAGPLYTTNPDSFIAQAIQSAGSDYLVKTHLPGDTIASEQVLLNPPDVIICDAAIVPQVKALPGWAQSVPAVRNNRFYTGTGGASLLRPGPRLPQAIEDLARWLHPDVFAGKPRIAAP